MKPELQRQNAALMICRAVLLTALLGAGLLIGRLLQQPLVHTDRFYLLLGAGYGLTILYALLHPFWSRHPASAYAQVAGDILLITGFAYVTGGVDSPFSLLYFLPVIAAGVMLGRAGAFASATTSWVTYAFLVVLIVYGWIPEPPPAFRAGLEAPPEAVHAIDRRVAYSLLSHFLGFFSVALLTSYLSAKLKTAGEQLEENREELAKLQALNKNIIDSITAGIVTTDLEGRITFMNRGGEEITGRRLAQIAATPIGAFLGQDSDFLARARENLDRERRFRFECSLPGRAGEARYLGLTSAVLKDQRGAPMGYIFSFQDLTDIKALEEEVRLKDRMAALGEMAAGIAHEIRNPLASMSGSVQILRRSMRPDAEESELLDIVLRESRRLDCIIRDFLLFARPGRFRPEPADLAALLSESLRLLRNSEEFGPSHGIETEFEPGAPEALVDPNMIKQVFWNLAKNALKAMPEGGALRVQVRAEPPASVTVSFADAGVGMSAEEARRAFEPFQSGFREGTGLGLAVVFRIVQEHAGRIRVKSRPGSGTEVVLTLPAARAAARAAVIGGAA